jgi:magnesium transporter
MTDPVARVAEPTLLDDLLEAWPLLDGEERLAGFLALDRSEADEFFLGLSSRDQAGLLLDLPAVQARSWLRLLAPDDAADLIQGVPDERREPFMSLLDDTTRREVSALLAFAQDEAGGLMNPRYARLRPEMSVDEAISYLRRQARDQTQTLPYSYVLDTEERLVGIVSYRQLFAATSGDRVEQVMSAELITVAPDTDQEEIARLIARHRLAAIPVVDAAGRMQGVVTADDIVEVEREEATEDIQKMGGTAALEAPYFDTGLIPMIRKRAGWLSVLFLGETLTATAMGRFEAEIHRAVVLALFVPLVISSGGNSGSQATTLVIRAMALGEVRLRDWWRVIHREFRSGLGLGLVLGVLGAAGILISQALTHPYAEGVAIPLALTVGLSLLGVVLWGTIVGSMLPFLMRRLGFDPAIASAPFVATLVDVTGLVIYFTNAQFMLRGVLL